MTYRCGAPTEDGTPCQNEVSREGALCLEHRISKRRVDYTTSGRYSRVLKRNRPDIARRVQELAEQTADTREEEALVRWMIAEYVEAFAKSDITQDQLYANLLAGMESLSRAYERREKVALSKQRVITPEDFIQLVALLGDIVQRRVSDLREKQLVAADFARVIQGHFSSLDRFPDKEFPSIPADAEPMEIIANALTAR